jgi:release factor glutamine methyltransferase
MRASEKLNRLAALLKTAGIEDPRREAEEIILLALGIDRARLIADDPEVDTGTERRKLAPIIERRMRRVPIQYIAGSVEFLGLTIKVGEGVLIPRPETEFLVEETIRLAAGKFAARGIVHDESVAREIAHDELAAREIAHDELAAIELAPDELAARQLAPDKSAANRLAAEKPKTENPRILDLCTGSGCIALALAWAFPAGRVDAVDISEAALGYARENAAINGIKNVRFMAGRLFSPIAAEGGQRYDLIVSNPPYIKSADIAGLQPEISLHEPREALDGGPDGLEFYREILGAARGYLSAGGLVALEAGFGQAADIAEIARRAGFNNVRFIADYGGVERIAVIDG